jgi:hypothetical protein
VFIPKTFLQSLICDNFELLAAPHFLEKLFVSRKFRYRFAGLVHYFNLGFFAGIVNSKHERTIVFGGDAA